MVEVFVEVLAFGGGLRPLPEHGQDSALDGLGNGVVGFFDTGQHGLGECFHVGFLDAFEALGDAGEDAGKDDAGVAPGAHQHPGGHGFRHFGQGGAFGPAARLDSHIHIVSRVPVGDGEDVEVVHGLPVGGQRRGAAADEVQVEVCVDAFHLMRGCSSGTSSILEAVGR